MPDVVTLVSDLARLRAEVESCQQQRAKLKAKGARDKVREADKQIAEAQAFYDTIAAQLPADVVKEATAYLDQLGRAQAAVDKANAKLRGLVPAEPDVTVAQAGGAAHDVTVKGS